MSSESISEHNRGSVARIIIPNFNRHTNAAQLFYFSRALVSDNTAVAVAAAADNTLSTCNNNYSEATAQQKPGAGFLFRATGNFILCIVYLHIHIYEQSQSCRDEMTPKYPSCRIASTRGLSQYLGT